MLAARAGAVEQLTKSMRGFLGTAPALFCQMEYGEDGYLRAGQSSGPIEVDACAHLLGIVGRRNMKALIGTLLPIAMRSYGYGELLPSIKHAVRRMRSHTQ